MSRRWRPGGRAPFRGSCPHVRAARQAPAGGMCVENTRESVSCRPRRAATPADVPIRGTNCTTRHGPARRRARQGRGSPGRSRVPPDERREHQKNGRADLGGCGVERPTQQAEEPEEERAVRQEGRPAGCGARQLITKSPFVEPLLEHARCDQRLADIAPSDAVTADDAIPPDHAVAPHDAGRSDIGRGPDCGVTRSHRGTEPPGVDGSLGINRRCEADRALDVDRARERRDNREKQPVRRHRP